jgi:hypothetical protein
MNLRKSKGYKKRTRTQLSDTARFCPHTPHATCEELRDRRISPSPSIIFPQTFLSLAINLYRLFTASAVLSRKDKDLPMKKETLLSRCSKPEHMHPYFGVVKTVIIPELDPVPQDISGKDNPIFVLHQRQNKDSSLQISVKLSWLLKSNLEH